jgi:hypothetical protein
VSNQSPGTTGGPSDIHTISLVDEMEKSYLDYAMSVIVSRALRMYVTALSRSIAVYCIHE